MCDDVAPISLVEDDVAGVDTPGDDRSSAADRGQVDAGREPARVERARRLVGYADPGTAAGAALTRLSDLAARLLRARSAQISIVTDVQAVVASASFGGGPVSHDMPAESGLCWQVVQAGAPVVITDAAGEPEVAGLPAVVSGDIGAYLGVPLIDVDGSVVGALCVFERGVREWSAHDVDLLTQLAGPALS